MTDFLIVDDDQFMLSVIERQIRAMGHESVTSFSDPREALGAIRLEPQRYSHLVLDINMPGIDGIQFLRNMPEGFDGKVVVVSGEHDEVRDWAAEMGEANNLNVVGQLSKPPKREDLEQLF